MPRLGVCWTRHQTWTWTPCLSPRSSVCRLSSREKISLQDMSKERRPGGAGGPPIRDEDEGEEAPAGRDTRTLGLRKEYGPGLLRPQIEVNGISCDIPFLFCT